MRGEHHATRSASPQSVERPDGAAERYAAYLETPAGRLRCELAFRNLAAFLPPPNSGRPPLRVLDLGGGTGELAIRLARLGFHVTLLDRSARMLEIAERGAREAAVTGGIVLAQGDAAAAPSLFAPGAFDVVTCHHVLEYADSPGDVLHAAARMIRRAPASVLSVVARNHAGAVLRTAARSVDLHAVERVIAAGEDDEPLFGGRVRLFTPAALGAMMQRASLELLAERGVRILFDYLAPPAVREAGEEQIVALEGALGARPEFSALARYTQVLARPSVTGCVRAEGAT